MIYVVTELAVLCTFSASLLHLFYDKLLKSCYFVYCFVSDIKQAMRHIFELPVLSSPTSERLVNRTGIKIKIVMASFFLNTIFSISSHKMCMLASPILLAETSRWSFCKRTDIVTAVCHIALPRIKTEDGYHSRNTLQTRARSFRIANKHAIVLPGTNTLIFLALIKGKTKNGSQLVTQLKSWIKMGSANGQEWIAIKLIRKNYELLVARWLWH